MQNKEETNDQKEEKIKRAADEKEAACLKWKRVLLGNWKTNKSGKTNIKIEKFEIKHKLCCSF